MDEEDVCYGSREKRETRGRRQARNYSHGNKEPEVLVFDLVSRAKQRISTFGSFLHPL